MSADQFTITIGDKTIKINKIIINNEHTNEYEFIIDYNYLQYYGKSFLKELKLDKFEDYLKFYEQNEEIKIKEINNNFYLELPIPFSTNCEIITLKKPELNEMDEFKILLKKQQDEFTEKLRQETEKLRQETEKNKDLENEIGNLWKTLNTFQNDINHNETNIKTLLKYSKDKDKENEKLRQEIENMNKEIKRLEKYQNNLMKSAIYTLSSVPFYYQPTARYSRFRHQITTQSGLADFKNYIGNWPFFEELVNRLKNAKSLTEECKIFFSYDFNN